MVKQDFVVLSFRLLHAQSASLLWGGKVIKVKAKGLRQGCHLSILSFVLAGGFGGCLSFGLLLRFSATPLVYLAAKVVFLFVSAKNISTFLHFLSHFRLFCAADTTFYYKLLKFAFQ